MFPADDPSRHHFHADPELGGLDEEVHRQRAIEQDLSRSARERYRARITGQAMARSVYVLTGKIVAVVGVVLFTVKAARRAVVATTAVGVAGGAVVVTGAFTTAPHYSPVPQRPATVVQPAAPSRGSDAPDPALPSEFPSSGTATGRHAAGRTAHGRHVTPRTSADPDQGTPHPGRVSGSPNTTTTTDPDTDSHRAATSTHDPVPTPEPTSAPTAEPTQPIPEPTLTPGPTSDPPPRTDRPHPVRTIIKKVLPPLRSLLPLPPLPSLLPSLLAPIHLPLPRL